MLAFQGPAQPSPTLGDALNAGYGYLEVHCLGCDTNQTIALDIVRRATWAKARIAYAYVEQALIWISARL